MSRSNLQYTHAQNIRRVRFPFIAGLSLILAIAVLVLISTLPLSLEYQFLFAVISLLLAIVLRKSSESHRINRAILIIISCIATSRYIYWRLTETLGWPDMLSNYTLLDCTFSISLLIAEGYAWATLFLGYFQTVWPLRRSAVALPEEQDLWPSVDVFIPTYNEPLKVVASSVLAAKRMDWPKDRLNVYILDDGCREEFKQFAEQTGVHYIERFESLHAKAGNINHALGQTSSDYVAIFDCDHSPVQNFLTRTMGWFLKDPRLALVQTPHVFFSPDPVERNLGLFRQVPNEGELFYGLIQDGNDTWNATFFCGSCAVLKREALEEVGGIAVETVTEDAHTSLRMHRRGWNSAYLNEPLAAGLATERLSAHVGQRTRWARGMVQIFRIDNPLFGRGLTWGQRLSYFNAMLHFLFSVPRLVFLLSPLAYLFFEAHIIQAAAIMIVVYAFPHILQAHVTNAALQGRYRHAFWAEVYETILATHIFWPTLLALINPSKGKFNVTDKGGIIDEEHFDWKTVRPVAIILILNAVALGVGIARLLLWNIDETNTVIVNLVWVTYNLIILGAAMSVAWEKQQLRHHARIPRHIKARVELADGSVYQAITKDLSLHDAGLKIAHTSNTHPGDFIKLHLMDDAHEYTFNVSVAHLKGTHMGVTFSGLSPEEMNRLVYFTHVREDSWEKWYGQCTPSKIRSSFFQVIFYGLKGLTKAVKSLLSSSYQRAPEMEFSLTGWIIIVLVLYSAANGAQII